MASYLEGMKYLDKTFGLTEEQQVSLQMYNDVFESLMYMSEESQKVVLYRLNKDIASKMGATEDAKKYVLYAGHYPTLWNYLAQMGLTNPDCLIKAANASSVDPKCLGKPVFSSSLIFKVVTKTPTGTDKFVKVIYNGNDVTSELTCAKDGYCSLEDFTSSFLKTDLFATEDEYDRHCQNYDVHLNSKLIALAVACVVFGLVMLVVFVKLLRQKLKSE